MDWETKGSKEVWKSDDGTRTIWQVQSTTGKLLQTYSKAISEVGFKGMVEQYTKETNGRVNTYIRQPKKEFTKGAKDLDSMYWMNALNNATALACAIKTASPPTAITEESILITAKYLYDNRPNASQTPQNAPESTQEPELGEPAGEHRVDTDEDFDSLVSSF